MFIFLTLIIILFFFFFFNDTATTEIYTLSLHDALPISVVPNSSNGLASLNAFGCYMQGNSVIIPPAQRSEEHTSELQSRFDLVCRLLLEKKKKKKIATTTTQKKNKKKQTK